MLKGKYVTIISPNSLQNLGLKTILEEFFLAENISAFSSYNEYAKNDTTQTDFIFLHSSTFIVHNEHFQNIKSKLIVFTDVEQFSLSPLSSISHLPVNISQGEIIELLQNIFNSKHNLPADENQEELSNREIDVLKLVSIGLINKQIADQLNISLHTVISHRKNITRKLGIKTVSGLTVYALLNGLVSSTEIE